MKKQIKLAVEEYQCSGCISGNDTKCFEKSSHSEACGKHRAGTLITGIGKIFLGLPRGFNRLGVGFGSDNDMTLQIIEKFGDWGPYNHFNVPVWKYQKDGHTLVRGLSPRTNRPFLHIYLEECADKIECFEVTEQLISEID